MGDLDKKELAFRYIHGSVQDDEKLQVFELIINDLEFKQILKSELELKKAMNCFRETLDIETKTMWLEKLKSKAYQLEEERNSEIDWLHWIVQWMAPAMPPSIHNLLKRSV